MDKRADPGHWCVTCQRRHAAIVWYYRQNDRGGREFLCGPKFRELKAEDKPRWKSFQP